MGEAIAAIRRSWTDEQTRTWEIIEALDLREITTRVRADLRVTVPTCAHDDAALDKLAIDMERRYRRYLFVRFKYALWTVRPDRLIATYWQTHVAYTRFYAEHCRAVFGKFLDHEPYSDQGAVRQHYDTAQLNNLLALEFDDLALTPVNDCGAIGDQCRAAH